VSFKLDTKPFSDIKVRQALQMAINRQDIADNYYGGTASATPVGLISASLKGYAYDYTEWPQTLKDEYAYNLTGAKQLLDDAGYPSGFSTNVVAANSDDLQLLQVFQDYFKDINVDMKINTYDWATYQSMMRAGKHDAMITFGGGFTWTPTRSIDEFYSQGSDNGATKVNDADYDALHAKFLSATTAAESAQAMHDADKRVIEQHWAVWAGESSTYIFWQPYLKGYSGEYLQWGRGLTYAKLWIDQSLKK
jgi:peptide/nickel transport system substrate-binding protein